MKKPISEVAVITGDIEGSSRLDANRRLDLYETFPSLSRLLREKYPRAVKYPVSNFRGDGWQLVVNTPEKSFEIALFIRTYIRFRFQKEKLDTRTAIGIGPVQFIPEDNVSAGDGPAYLVSGRLLEGFSSSFMGIAFSEVQGDGLLMESLETLIDLLDFQVTSWGAGHAQSINLALQGLTQYEIASSWHPDPIKQPSVSKSLQTAGWQQIKNSLFLIEKLILGFMQGEGN